MARLAVAVLLSCPGLFWAADGHAQSNGRAAPGAPKTGTAPHTDAPPPPELPDTIRRDEQGRATLRAVRVTEPIRLDGRLEEAIYSTIRPAADFMQSEPLEGVPATEDTDVWVMFDDRTLYLSFRCHESQPERMVLNEMRRDSFNVIQNDGISFMLDTFHDRRNGVSFIVTPIGGRMDGQITNERTYNADWNPIWRFATATLEKSWTAEVAIPFRSLRYGPGHEQVWGIQVSRRSRYKNEVSFLTRIPNSIGQRGIFQISMAATLVGLEVPTGSHNVEIKPYAIGDLTTNLDATPPFSNEPGRDAGVDVKVGLTQNLTLDLTYNTDFAQVEADEQQVNLTRFSLFFPEKREFFLENQGMFQFGAGIFGQAGGGGGGGGGGGQFSVPSEAPILFYSRRIGLDSGREIPIEAGGRLTGRIGRFSLGLLNIATDNLPSSAASTSETPATNFAALRVKRDLLRRSSVGMIATHRSRASAAGATGANDVYGVDGTFAFFTNLNINTYWAQTRTEGLAREDDVSYQAQLDYTGDRYGVQLERLVVGDNFNPELGFVRRDDMRRSFGLARFSPRPKASRVVRKLTWMGSLSHIEDRFGQLSTRETNGEFGIEFHNSDRLQVVYTDSYEFLKNPFEIVPTVTIPVGPYVFGAARVAFTLGQQRKLAGTIEAERGTFYDGERTTLGFTRGRLEVTRQFALEPSVSVNRVRMPYGDFTTTLATSRVTYTLTPMMFVSALLQYNTTTDRVSANARLRWEYQPGSELFVVFNEERDTLAPRFPGLRNRSVVVKVTRLFRL